MKHGSSYLNWLKCESHLYPLLLVWILESFITFLKVFEQSCFVLFLITCVKSSYLSHSKQRSSTGIYCHMTVIELSLISRAMKSGFTPEILGICFLTQSRFLLHLLCISLSEPGQVSMQLWPGWFFHTVSSWRPKQVGGLSQIFTIFFLSGQDIYALVPYLTKLSDKFL